MNKKILKLLSTIAIAGALGTGVAFGVAGCTPKNEDETEQTTITYVGVSLPTSARSLKTGDTCTLYPFVDGTGEYSQSVTWVVEEGENLIQWDSSNGNKFKAVGFGTLKLHAQSVDDVTKVSETITLNIADSRIAVPAGTVGLIAEGVEDTTLSSEKTSFTLNKSSLKVYFANGNTTTKGTEVDSEHYTVKLLGPDNQEISLNSKKTAWENLKTAGTYTLSVQLTNANLEAVTGVTLEDLVTTKTFTIANPAVANSLTVKTGDGVLLTQAKSATDKMTSTWTYEYTLANGDKVAVDASNVKVEGLNTSTVGENTANLSYNLSATETITGTVTYSITENANLHTKSVAFAFQSLTGSVAGGTKLVDNVNGTTITAGATGSTTGEIQDDSGKGEGKYFSKRFKFGGGSFVESTGLFHTNNRYIEITVDGAAKLTVYWMPGGASEERGIRVYSQADLGTKTIADMTLTGTEYLYQKSVQSGEMQKSEITLSAAGTYYLTSSNHKDIRLYYIQVDTEFEQAGGTDKPLATGIVEAKDIELTTPDTIPPLTVGGKFSSPVTAITVIRANSVTCAMTEETITDLSQITYKMGDTVVTTETTITADMLGTQTITVVYAENVTKTYNVTVESAIPGVTGAAVDAVAKTVDSGAATTTVSLTDFVATATGTAAAADLTITVDSVVIKSGETVAATLNSTNASATLGKGEYTAEATVTVTLKADTAKTAQLTATTTVKVLVVGEFVSDKGEYTVTVSGSAENGRTINQVAASGEVPATMFDFTGLTTTKDSNDLKFGSNNDVVTIKANVAKGQTISIYLELKTSSSNKNSGIVCSTASTTISLTSASAQVNATTNTYVTGTVTYTASADGEVVITLKRDTSSETGGYTAKVKTLKVTIADAATSSGTADLEALPGKQYA